MSTDDTITAWGNHVDGAVALTKLRGIEQFNDPMSHAMFRAVRTMMVNTNNTSFAYHNLTKNRLQAAFNARNPSTLFLVPEVGSATATSQKKTLPIG